jgi:hypothetical protein
MGYVTPTVIFSARTRLGHLILAPYLLIETMNLISRKNVEFQSY